MTLDNINHHINLANKEHANNANNIENKNSDLKSQSSNIPQDTKIDMSDNLMEHIDATNEKSNAKANIQSNIKTNIKSNTNQGQLLDKSAILHIAQDMIVKYSAQGGQNHVNNRQSSQIRNTYEHVINNNGAPHLSLSSVIKDPQNAALILNSLMDKMLQTSLKGSMDQMNIKTHMQDANAKEQVGKMDQNIKELNKAKHASFWQKLFGWIATALTFIVGVIATVATGGATLGPLIAASTVLLLNVLQQSGALASITSKIVDALSGSDTAKMIINLIIGIAIAIAAVASAQASGATSLASSVGRFLQNTAKGLCAITNAGSGMSGIANSAIMYESNDQQAAVKMLMQRMQRSEQIVDLMKALITKLNQTQQEVTKTISSIVQGSHATANIVAANMKA